MLLLFKLLNLLLKSFFHLKLRIVEMIMRIPRLNLGARQLILQFLDPFFLRRGAHLFIDT